jgi:hypothetical protein
VCTTSGSDTNPDKAQIQLTNIIGLAIVLVVGLFAAGLVEVVPRIIFVFNYSLVAPASGM